MRHQLKVWVRQMVETLALKELLAKQTLSGVEGLEAASIDLSKLFSIKIQTSHSDMLGMVLPPHQRVCVLPLALKYKSLQPSRHVDNNAIFIVWGDLFHLHV